MLAFFQKFSPSLFHSHLMAMKGRSDILWVSYTAFYSVWLVHFCLIVRVNIHSTNPIVVLRQIRLRRRNHFSVTSIKMETSAWVTENVLLQHRVPVRSVRKPNSQSLSRQPREKTRKQGKDLRVDTSRKVDQMAEKCCIYSLAAC